MANVRTGRIHDLIKELRKIGPAPETASAATTKFIIDSTPFDNPNPNPTASSGTLIITGRLLPNSAIYQDGSIAAHIILGPSFPLEPPTVRLETKVYHPNVDEKGKVSVDLLNPQGSWTPSTSLVSVVEAVTDIIDNPSLDLFLNADAARDYREHRQTYEETARATFNNNPSPRI